jgi:hypothetical protein
MAINVFISSSYSGVTVSTGPPRRHPRSFGTEDKTEQGIQTLFKLTLPVRPFNVRAACQSTLGTAQDRAATTVKLSSVQPHVQPKQADHNNGDDQHS